MNIHAHLVGRSRDCDGEYRDGRVDAPTREERNSEFGDIDFKHRVISGVISVYAEHATLVVTPDRVEWLETTEEGYRETTVTWCEDNCEFPAGWQRDMSAEEAGY